MGLTAVDSRAGLIGALILHYGFRVIDRVFSMFPRGRSVLMKSMGTVT